MRSANQSYFMPLFWCLLLCLLGYISYAALKPRFIKSRTDSTPVVNMVRESAPNLSTSPATAQVPQGVHDAYFSGFKTARDRKITAADACTGEPSFVLGCKVSAMLLLEANQFEQLSNPKFWMQGKTTADCEIEMNAKFDKLASEYPNTTTRHAVDFMNRNHRFIELDRCSALDKSAGLKAIWSASARLSTAIGTLKFGGSISAEDQAQISKDREHMNQAEFPGKNGWKVRDRYNEQAEEYTVLLRSASLWRSPPKQ
jgi:hypothetical protein